MGLGAILGGAGIGAGGGLSGAAAGAAGAILMTKSARNWEEKMRRTAWQTTVKDLEKAGLNPSLAFSQGPTTSHSVATTQLPDFGGAMMEGAEMGIGTAKQMQTIPSEVAKLKADTEVAKATAEKTPGLLEAQNMQMTANAAKAWEESKAAIASRGLMEQQTRMAGINSDLLRFQLPSAKARAGFDSSEMGDTMNRMRRFLDLINPLTGMFRTSAKGG